MSCSCITMINKMTLSTAITCVSSPKQITALILEKNVVIVITKMSYHELLSETSCTDSEDHLS